MKFDAQYFDRQYRGRRLGNRARARYWASWSRRRADASCVLEIGPGLGDFAAAYPSTLVCVDVSSDAAVEARARGATYVTLGTAAALPFRSDSFEVVVAFDVFEHVPLVVAALSEAFRVLRHGGALVLSVPNVDGIGARWKRGADPVQWYGDADPTHIHLLPISDWIRLVQNAGLVIERWGSDSLWDAPYPTRIPDWLQKAITVPLQVVLSLLLGMAPWRGGENLLVVAAKPCTSAT